ncbi:MAG: hypothetical protein ACN4GM_12880 [Gammaproteobacteria bacterium]
MEKVLIILFISLQAGFQSSAILANEYDVMLGEIINAGYKLKCDHTIDTDHYYVYLNNKSIYTIDKIEIPMILKEKMYRGISWKFIGKNNKKMYQERPKEQVFEGRIVEGVKHYALNVQKIDFFSFSKETVSVYLMVTNVEGPTNEYKEICKITIDENLEPLLSPEELEGIIIERRVKGSNENRINGSD